MKDVYKLGRLADNVADESANLNRNFELLEGEWNLFRQLSEAGNEEEAMEHFEAFHKLVKLGGKYADGLVKTFEKIEEIEIADLETKFAPIFDFLKKHKK